MEKSDTIFSSRGLLGAPRRTTRSKDATRGSWHRYSTRGLQRNKTQTSPDLHRSQVLVHHPNPCPLDIPHLKLFHLHSQGLALRPKPLRPRPFGRFPFSAKMESPGAVWKVLRVVVVVFRCDAHATFRSGKEETGRKNTKRPTNTLSPDRKRSPLFEHTPFRPTLGVWFGGDKVQT